MSVAGNGEGKRQNSRKHRNNNPYPDHIDQDGEEDRED